MVNYDKVILESIENKWLTANQISEETGINRTRVNIRLKSLMRYNMVISIQSSQSKRGVNPFLYKKR